MSIYSNPEIERVYNSKKAIKIRASGGKHIPCKDESKFIRKLCIKYNKTKEELLSDKNHRREIAMFMKKPKVNMLSLSNNHRKRFKRIVRDKINSIAKEMNLSFMNPKVLQSAMEYFRKNSYYSRSVYNTNHALLIVKEYYNRAQK